MIEPSLYTVKALFILDSDGKRILAKYYDENLFSSNKSRVSFETRLFGKTCKMPAAEIILFEGLTCVYKNNGDLYFYIIGDGKENELMLYNALQCFYDAINQILRKNVEKKQLMESLDLVLLAMDELCDRGVIIESDSGSLVNRVGVKQEEIPMGEQTISQVFQSAKEQFKLSNFLKG